MEKRRKFLSFEIKNRIWGQGCPQKAPASHGWRIRRRSVRYQQPCHRKLRTSSFSESEHQQKKSCLLRRPGIHPSQQHKSTLPPASGSPPFPHLKFSRITPCATLPQISGRKEFYTCHPRISTLSIKTHPENHVSRLSKTY